MPKKATATAGVANRAPNTNVFRLLPTLISLSLSHHSVAVLFLHRFSLFCVSIYIFIFLFFLFCCCFSSRAACIVSLKGAGVSQLVFCYDDLFAVGRLESDGIAIDDAWQTRSPTLEPLNLCIRVAVEAVARMRHERVCRR